MPLLTIGPNYDLAALLVQVSENEVEVLKMPHGVESVSMMSGPVDGTPVDGLLEVSQGIPPECDVLSTGDQRWVRPSRRLSQSESTLLEFRRRFVLLFTSAIAALVADLAIFQVVGIDPYGLHGLLVGKSAIPATIGALMVSSALLAVCTCLVQLRRHSVRDDPETSSHDRTRVKRLRRTKLSNASVEGQRLALQDVFS